MDGFEIAELYVTDVKSSVERTVKELKGFEKGWIPTGQSKQVSITLKTYAFYLYDVKKHDWRLEKGAFKISVGGSSDNLKLRNTVNL